MIRQAPHQRSAATWRRCHRRRVAVVPEVWRPFVWGVCKESLAEVGCRCQCMVLDVSFRGTLYSGCIGRYWVVTGNAE